MTRASGTCRWTRSRCAHGWNNKGSKCMACSLVQRPQAYRGKWELSELMLGMRMTVAGMADGCHAQLFGFWPAI
jgi:hypothetical protein